MTSVPRVRALVFDVFGTVVDWRGGVIREAALAAGPQWADVDWAAFADAWRARYAPSMDLVRNGSSPWLNLDTLHRRSLDALLVEFGLDGLGPEQREQLVDSWHRLDPWPDAVAGLTRLRANYVIGTLSNGNVALLVDMAKRAGLPWDLVLSAELVEHYKPDPETYRLPGRLLGVPDDQVMLVAAHLNDLEAAHRLGLRTCFVPRPLEHGPHGPTTRPQPTFAVDLIVDDFGQLADRLGG